MARDRRFAAITSATNFGSASAATLNKRGTAARKFQTTDRVAALGKKQHRRQLVAVREERRGVEAQLTREPRGPFQRRERRRCKAATCLGQALRGREGVFGITPVAARPRVAGAVRRLVVLQQAAAAARARSGVRSVQTPP